MNKPVRIETIEIHTDKQLSAEEFQKMCRQIREKNEKEIHEYNIYRKGLEDARGGLLGIFGL